jgi:hypothetical protein
MRGRGPVQKETDMGMRGRVSGVLWQEDEEAERGREARRWREVRRRRGRKREAHPEGEGGEEENEPSA